MTTSLSKPTKLAMVPTPPREALADRHDDELVALTRGGMQQAFDVLVKRHQGRALRVAQRYLNDVTLARDATQQAFLSIYRGLDRYQASGKFSAYLCRVVLNQSRMLVRSRASAQRSAQMLALQQSVSAETAMLRVQRRDLQLAISQLSEKLRVVVILRYGGDLDLAEIGDALQIPLGTVKRRLFVAMDKLRATLDDEP